MNGPLDYEETLRLTQDFVCGECGARLSNPWGGFYGINGYIVRCVKDQDHQGVRRPGNPTRKLYDPKEGLKEYDIMTQQPVMETQDLALGDYEKRQFVRPGEIARNSEFDGRAVGVAVGKLFGVTNYRNKGYSAAELVQAYQEYEEGN